MNNPQDQYNWFEAAILALERTLGARITVIDNRGIFHTPAGRLIFPMSSLAPMLEAFAGGKIVAHVAELNTITQLPLDRPARVAEYLQRFCDEYHFSKIFRKETGQPPGQFRREHQLKPS